MKKLAVIALALVTLTGFAQEKGQKKMNKETRSELRKEMTPTDIADLKSKKLTLKLDLTNEQQSRIHKLFLKQSEKNQKLRAANKVSKDEVNQKPSKDEFVKRQNERLDHQIEMKREMKAILTADQYAKFEKMEPRQLRKKEKHNKKRARHLDKKQ